MRGKLLWGEVGSTSYPITGATKGRDIRSGKRSRALLGFVYSNCAAWNAREKKNVVASKKITRKRWGPDKFECVGSVGRMRLSPKPGARRTAIGDERKEPAGSQKTKDASSTLIGD